MVPSIRIWADIFEHDRSICRFTVDRSVHKGFARFSSKEAALGSPLIERLYAIEGVTAVLVRNQEVTVTKTPPVDWQATGPIIGAAIRAHIQSGKPAISPEAALQLSPEDQLRQKVQDILDTQINPAIASHGGYIGLLDVKGTTLLIQMGGGCQGCGMANATLRDGVEKVLRQQIPEITAVYDVTDHAGGENPYCK
ncbi:MAG: NifU family protein [Elusimicrobiota bacterium]|jgi:Fe-S cluster biogenesis protein NfuA